MLPEATVLGELKIIEVYEFYIQPALFSCRNRAGQIYLAAWIDDGEEFSRWLYVALSSARFAAVRCGEIGLRHAFAKPEDGIALDVVIHSDPSQASEVTPIPAGQIEESWLPESQEHLDIETPMPEELRAGSSSHLPYSKHLSTWSFSMQASQIAAHRSEPRDYTDATKPLVHGVYEIVRRQITRSTADDRNPSFAMRCKAFSESAIVA